MTATVPTGNGRDGFDSVLDLPRQRRVIVEARLVGITPLITHRFGEKAKEDIQRRQGQAAKLKKEVRDPRRDFEEALYKLGDGKYGFPAIGVKKAMVIAGQRFADEKGTELYGVMTIPGEFLTIESPNPPRMREDRVVLSGPSRPLDIAYRPEFWPWAMTVPIIVNTSLISVEKVLNFLDLAGTAVGIGNWRVDKKGTFGMWKVGDVRVIEG